MQLGAVGRQVREWGVRLYWLSRTNTNTKLAYYKFSISRQQIVLHTRTCLCVDVAQSEDDNLSNSLRLNTSQQLVLTPESTNITHNTKELTYTYVCLCVMNCVGPAGTTLTPSTRWQAQFSSQQGHRGATTFQKLGCPSSLSLPHPSLPSFAPSRPFFFRGLLDSQSD